MWEQMKNTRHIIQNMSDIFQNISDIFFERSFGGVLNADKRVASACLLMSVPV